MKLLNVGYLSRLVFHNHLGTMQQPSQADNRTSPGLLILPTPLLFFFKNHLYFSGYTQWKVMLLKPLSFPADTLDTDNNRLDYLWHWRIRQCFIANSIRIRNRILIQIDPLCLKDYKWSLHHHVHQDHIYWKCDSIIFFFFFRFKSWPNTFPLLC